MNALAFSGTNFSLVGLQIMVKKNVKDMIWHLKSFREPETNGMKIECNELILSIKGCVKKNEARAYINNVDEAMLEYYRVFSNQIKTMPPEPQLSDFYHPSEGQKMVNYYLLQWVQAWQDMLFTRVV